MGEDKAWLPLAGRPMIQHVIDAVKPVVNSLGIIANDARYSELGLPIYRDLNIGVGPLEAIRTALSKCDLSRVLLVACDLPFVSSELFEFLLDVRGDHDAIVPLGPDGRLETLCAVYSPRALESVATLIARGERMIRTLFDIIPTRVVAFDELRHLAGSQHFFENINSPEDYARVIKLTE